MSMSSFAGVANLGTYRPYGLAGYEGTTSYDTWYDSYEGTIDIFYIDSNTLMALRGPDTLVLTCVDPINHPDIYCNFYEGTTTPMQGISTSDKYPDQIMYFINLPAVNKYYYYTMQRYK